MRARYSQNLTRASPQLTVPITRGERLRQLVRTCVDYFYLHCTPCLFYLLLIAYHTAVVAPLDGRDCLLVWRGLHQGAPTAQLELCNLETHTWRAGRTQGQEPAPRFGHTCVPLRADEWRAPACTEGRVRADLSATVDRLLFTGGSNGSDLVRNGIEFREVS